MARKVNSSIRITAKNNRKNRSKNSKSLFNGRKKSKYANRVVSKHGKTVNRRIKGGVLSESQNLEIQKITDWLNTKPDRAYKIAILKQLIQQNDISQNRTLGYDRLNELLKAFKFRNFILTSTVEASNERQEISRQIVQAIEDKSPPKDIEYGW